MSDIFLSYVRGLDELLRQLGQDHQGYAEALTLQAHLQESIAQTRTYSDTSTGRSQ